MDELSPSRDETYTVDEVARLTDRHPNLIRRWLAEGRIQATKMPDHGHEYRFTAVQVIEILKIPKRKRS